MAAFDILAGNQTTFYNKIGNGAQSMKIILRILLFPIIAALNIFIRLAGKVVQISAIVLNFIAVATALGAICIIFDGRTVHGIAGLVAAFLLTPYGLPLLTIMLLGQVQRFKCWLQDCVY